MYREVDLPPVELLPGDLQAEPLIWRSLGSGSERQPSAASRPVPTPAPEEYPIPRHEMPSTAQEPSRAHDDLYRMRARPKRSTFLKPALLVISALVLGLIIGGNVPWHTLSIGILMPLLIGLFAYATYRLIEFLAGRRMRRRLKRVTTTSGTSHTPTLTQSHTTEPPSLPSRPPMFLAGRVRVGIRSRPLGAAKPGDGDALKGWLETGDFTYHLVRIVCQFRPSENERVTGAEVTVRLYGEPNKTRPVVWSLIPKEEWDESSGATTTVKIGANFKFFEASREAVQTGHRRLLVQGMGELQPEAVWNLADSGRGLLGDRQFLLVIQQVVGTAANCALSVEVSLANGRLSRRGDRYRANLPEDARKLVLAG